VPDLSIKMAKAEHYLVDLDNRLSATIYPKGNRKALQVPHSFSFVLNISRLADHAASFQLASGHELRRANDVEIKAIKDVLPDFAAQTTWGAWQNGEPILEGDKTTYAHIPEEEWRYFVISFDGSNSISSQIERSLCLAPFELKIGFTVLREVFRGSGAPALLYHPARLFAQVKRLASDELPFIEMTPAAIETIKSLSDQIQKCDYPSLNLKRLLDQILDLDALPYDSPLLFLGYFAILESLLTHQPKKTDTIDSIARQVKQKVVLLDNRWSPRIDYGRFGGAKVETVWSAMYSYRSCLAHGGVPDFENDLQLLQGPDQALELLKQTVKSVLRQILIEPQLINDLRNC
jgi:hypothetical protein